MFGGFFCAAAQLDQATALRVNLFSVVCTTAMIVCVYFLARLFRASVAGAAVGALTLATAA